ncbi:protein of unknown function [Mucilaginibacter sp. OK268]|uniref:eCIS core domain-containing protein n=1 Tax=Mucilaginibacter sp. OK268 TaxID=1881048 RepID=UPI00087F245A|nr:DUF4157 domain-containing protein [Mucilaginibacter sp. OK268]SDP92448.1 protein of unknown function [Mucilaginibacter sp. OK268]
MNSHQHINPVGKPENHTASKPLFFQPKLTVNQPNDVYEQEADNMADRVMRMTGMPQNENAFFKSALTGIQRKCQHCEEEEKTVHRKENSGAEVQGSHELDSYIGSLGSSGQALPESSRSFFEPRLGHDFSNVRIHADSVAAKSAQSINALAYTTGNNIVFNSGQYAPENDSGKKLMAHELTHVVQQNAVKNNTIVQRELAIEPQGAAAGVTKRILSKVDIKDAIRVNKSVFGTKEAVKQVRDVIGTNDSTVIDEEFVLAVAEFQFKQGVAQDGKVGPVTMMIILEELQAEKQTETEQKVKNGFQVFKPTDINTSHCGCQQELKRAIAGTQFFIPFYEKCETQPGVVDGKTVEACVLSELKKIGVKTKTAGTTDPTSGDIKVKPVPGKCGKLHETDTLAHEQVHHVHVKELEQANGAGTTALNKAINDPHDWVADEINARKTNVAVLNFMIQALDGMCAVTP